MSSKHAVSLHLIGNCSQRKKNTVPQSAYSQGEPIPKRFLIAFSAFKSLYMVTCKSTKFYGILKQFFTIIFSKRQEENCKSARPFTAVAPRTPWGRRHSYSGCMARNWPVRPPPRPSSTLSPPHPKSRPWRGRRGDSSSGWGRGLSGGRAGVTEGLEVGQRLARGFNDRKELPGWGEAIPPGMVATWAKPRITGHGGVIQQLSPR